MSSLTHRRAETHAHGLCGTRLVITSQGLKGKNESLKEVWQGLGQFALGMGRQ